MTVARRLLVIAAIALAPVTAHAGEGKAPALPEYGTILPPDTAKKSPAVVPFEPAPASPATTPAAPIDAKLPDPIKVPPVIPLTPGPLGQVPDQLPSQFPSQFPTQMPTQLPSQLPTQWPSQLPTQLPGAPADVAIAPSSTAGPTSPTSTATESAVAASPSVMPLSIAPPELPAPTSQFQGFAMNDRSYELASLALPTPTRAGASAVNGTVTLGDVAYTLYNVRVSGPWVVRAPSSPFGGGYHHVKIWQLAGDLYRSRRVGWAWVRIMQKEPAGPQIAIADGQIALWYARYRVLASGSLNVGGPLALPAAAAPAAPSTEDLRNRP